MNVVFRILSVEVILYWPPISMVGTPNVDLSGGGGERVTQLCWMGSNFSTLDPMPTLNRNGWCYEEGSV
jgi:hypothetical protein